MPLVQFLQKFCCRPGRVRPEFSLVLRQSGTGDRVLQGRKGDNPLMIVLGNKCDLPFRAVTSGEAKKWSAWQHFPSFGRTEKVLQMSWDELFRRIVDNCLNMATFTARRPVKTQWRLLSRPGGTRRPQPASRGRSAGVPPETIDFSVFDDSKVYKYLQAVPINSGSNSSHRTLTRKEDVTASPTARPVPRKQIHSQFRTL